MKPICPGPAYSLAAMFGLFCILAASPAQAEPMCGDDFTAISRIQGAGDRSPLEGRQVVVEGIVAGVFTGRDELSGFYIRSAPAEADGDSATSEGLFIHAPESQLGGWTPVPGQRIRAEGRVKEFHGLTELTAAVRVQQCSSAQQAPEPAPLNWPLVDPERLEGMPVEIGPLTVIEQRQLQRFGTLRLAPEPLVTPTQVAQPGSSAAAALTDANRERNILLDDGSNKTYPDQVYRLDPEAGRPLRLGDQVRPFQAIVDYRYGEWRLQPLKPIALSAVNDRREPTPAPPNTVRMAAFNLANFFNGDGRGGGFPTSRGAESKAEFLRQKEGLVAALTLLDADLIAVSEVENDGYGPDSAIAGLAAALGPGWSFVNFGPAEASHNPGRNRSGDEISNGILYRHDLLDLAGKPAVLDSGAFARGNRPALAAAFIGTGMAAPVVAVANHLKSKRCNNAEDENADQGDGQGCWAPVRTRAVHELVSWLKTNPTGSQPGGTVLLGDFNSYRQEDPMAALRQADFHNPALVDAYSYVFDGRRGTLDYTWVSEGLSDRIVGAGVWHANADEGGPYTGTAGEPWGISDHDPVWVDLAL